MPRFLRHQLATRDDDERWGNALEAEVPTMIALTQLTEIPLICRQNASYAISGLFEISFTSTHAVE